MQAVELSRELKTALESGNEKITSIGMGSWNNERVVFCVIDFENVVISSHYPDKVEYGMYYLEEWCQSQINRNRANDAFTYQDISVLDSFSGFSSITRIKKPATPKKRYNIYGNMIPEPHNAGVKTKRNEPCICGSGKKYKKCCL